MEEYIQGKITLDQLFKIGKESKIQVATKKELKGFLKNDFTIDLMAKVYDVKKPILIKRVKAILKRL